MRLKSLVTGLTAMFAAAPAIAQEGLQIIGAPTDKGLGFQPAATELARDLQWLDGMMLWIITAISIFVVGLLAIVVVRYNRRANPEPATFTHNTPVEVLWTVGPILILLFIGSFSLPVLFKQQEIPEGEVNIKVTGYQWYWGYEYTDHDFGFDSYMIGQPATVGNYVLNDEVEAALIRSGLHTQRILTCDRHSCGCSCEQNCRYDSDCRGCDPLMDNTSVRGKAGWRSRVAWRSFGSKRKKKAFILVNALNCAVRTTHTCQSQSKS
jgi:cytochrome c oxidase subunit 2